MPGGARALLDAARRLGGLLAVIGGLTVLLSLLAGLALGSSAARSAATGLYLVGAFLLLVGVVAGVRGPVRPKDEVEGREAIGGLFGIGVFSKGIRTASPDERRDAQSTSWLFLTIGVLLIVLGVAIDGRTSVL